MFWRGSEVAPITPADEDSVSHLCEISEESPHGNTILHHLRTKFELSELERVGKTLIQRDILELLPDRPVEVVESDVRNVHPELLSVD